MDDAQEHARKIRLMYQNFWEILACNDSILQLIADIEDRLSGPHLCALQREGQFPAGFSFVSNHQSFRRGVIARYYTLDDLRRCAAADDEHQCAADVK